MDRISVKKRSWNMGQIKSTNTKPEKIVRSFIHNAGLRFRLHDKNLPGRPDIILKKYNTVIFVDGCFWHRHKGCKYSYTPKSRKKFWEHKFEKNIERDKVVNKSYNSIHWRLIRIWECEIDEERLHNLVNQIKNSYF
tara:strand:- start:59 stop:469 length:411 start_codon:yes stop_codon:yes gene_type:complete